MAKIEDFEKRYVTSVSFKNGDKILVTKENIKDLRKILKNTNFRWTSGHHITDCISFQTDRVILLDNESAYGTLDQIDEEQNADYLDAINYVFINY